MSLWTIETPLSGSPVLIANLDGSVPVLIDCPTCPCDQWCVLAAEAIRERQIALGWSPELALDLSATYTLNELQAIAATTLDGHGTNYFILPSDNSWNGGTSWPAVFHLGEQYDFYTASTCEELYNMVAALCHVFKDSWTISWLPGVRYYGYGTGSTLGDAVDAAHAAFSLYSPTGGGGGGAALLGVGWSTHGYYTAYADCYESRGSVAELPATLPHCLNLYISGSISGSNVYDAQGQAVSPVEDYIVWAGYEDYNTNTSYAWTLLDPTIFPANYDAGVTLPRIFGFTGDVRVVVSFAFEHSACTGSSS